MGESARSITAGSIDTCIDSNSSDEDSFANNDDDRPVVFRKNKSQHQTSTSTSWMPWGSSSIFSQSNAPCTVSWSSSTENSTDDDDPSIAHQQQQSETIEIDSTVATEPAAPLSLEGTLSFRKSRSASGSSAWKQGYVVLNLTDGGSLTCFREKPEQQSTSSSTMARRRSTLSRRRRRTAPGDTRPRLSGTSLLDRVSGIVNECRDSYGNNGNGGKDAMLRFHVGANIPWSAKDIESSSSEFVIEIPTKETSSGITGAEDLLQWIEKDYQADAASGKPFRLYFRCARKSVEKALWLQALEQIDRLSNEMHSKRGIQTLFRSNIKVKHRRTRNQLSTLLAREGSSLLVDRNDLAALHEDDPGYNQPLQRFDGRGEKEFLVYPKYAYPNRWMTEREIHTEMLKPSETFHDLRNSRNTAEKEIGVLKVEALECIGLPSLDFASETDAVVYFVCGCCAFATDVIWNRLNPKWLPKSRRACVFPVYHAYQLLYCGVFDDDGVREKDDFAGRVTIALSRLRPRSTYDVTLPLRMSSQVYSQNPRGSIRLRFSIEWHSERDALLSYIPKTIRPPSRRRPEDDVTIVCANEKAFRNVATTVHGIHMPSRFSPQEFKATMRELALARKVATNTARDLVLEIVLWKNPVLSGLIFCAWMHTVSQGSFSLVPFYATFFLCLGMIRTYSFYGSDGPIHQGFIPPSLEEMTATLLTSKETKVIEPLQIRPVQHKGNDGRRTYRSTRNVTRRDSVTHRQRGKWLFELLGFKSREEDGASAEFYDMEFPFSQGLKDPISGKIRYKKYAVQESLVIKSKRSGKKTSVPLDNENALDDLFSSRHGPDTKSTGNRRFSFERLPSLSGGMRRRNSSPPWVPATRILGESDHSAMDFYDLPPRLRIPDQNIDSKGPAKRKKLADELDEFRENVHRLSLHMFNDRTHVPPKEGALYFGNSPKSGKSGAALEAELGRLLNTGPYSTSNPVIARAGLFMTPIVESVQSILCITRVIYNIFTWRDPMLSFWFTALLLVASLVLLIFPWRLFLFATAMVIAGPQNWLLQVLCEKRMAPAPLQNAFDKLEHSKHIGPSNRRKEERLKRDEDEAALKQQPIFCGHTSENAAPPEVSHGDVNPKALHQVCIPYSQLNGTTRFYDWPPETQYAKCTPNQ